jgi:hypothetical protein
MLVKMEHIGGCKPSQLLAVMMEFCHAKSEKSLPFHYYFAHHLLQVLRTQLEVVEQGDQHALVARLIGCGRCMHPSLPQSPPPPP